MKVRRCNKCNAQIIVLNNKIEIINKPNNFVGNLICNECKRWIKDVSS